ncbi:hypothetical protein E5S70_33315 [Ensifer adhaerens]|uniref:hypothetical protein n=1 Tax=Ensifer canadensis TaxID=555315 RepID=UPI00148FE6D1|nr:hypothetical protein [Ensifer canadensis]NOV20855.1 hypothetical protein [Ensifer canadensis]
MTDHAKLSSFIAIHLAVIDQSTKRRFAGTGVSRRREQDSARSIAEELVRHIRINHRIERAGTAVDDAEVVALVAAELWKLPDAVAKDLVAIDANRKEVARAAIVNALVEALTRSYEFTFLQPEYRGMGPSIYKAPNVGPRR